MIKLIEQSKRNSITALSDLNNGDVFMKINTFGEVSTDYLYMKVKEESNCSFICWNFVGNYFQNISPNQDVHKCASATLNYTI